MHVLRSSAVLCLALLFAFPLSIARGAETTSTKPNILMIISDDLNDWIGPMKGHPQAKTPNIDKLAARGVTFRNNHCPAPLCNPSRAAIMSGMRPSTTGIYDNQHTWMPHVPVGHCINAYIRTGGYRSLGAGKIFHYRNYRTEEWDALDYATDDTLPNHPVGNRKPGPLGYRMFTDGQPSETWEEQREEGALADSRSVKWCAERLAEETTAPFFMVCGIHRPHTPWDIPKKYFDMFPLESVQLPEVLPNDLDDVPAQGREFASYTGSNSSHAKILEMDLWKDRVRAYLAAVAFADARVGELLNALDKSAHKNNTVIVFVGDHGWHLGEKQHWGKATLWNESTRTPMIWVAPGLTAAGSFCDQGVDMMSLYPTICELAGIPTPKHVEGISIRPLLTNPNAEWTTPALSTMHKGNHTLVTDKWRYISYHDGTEELYDEKTDPNEWTNLAGKPEYAELKQKLARFLPKKNAEPVEATKKKKKGKGKGKGRNQRR
jgi:arylsulfatase A-like enzyme